NPVVRVEVEGKEKFDMQVNFETWREAGYKLNLTTYSDMYNFNTGGSASLESTANENNPYPTIAYPDVIVPGKKDRIVWYHHNVKSGCELTMKVQGLESYYETMTDPLFSRTFGGTIKGDGFVTKMESGEGRDGYVTKRWTPNDRILESVHPSTKQNFNIYLLTEHPVTVRQWLKDLDELISRVDKIDIEDARRAHQNWWNDLWNRSWIHATGNEDAEQVSKSYTLQRYIFACNGRGLHPIKFNGFMFTVPREENPDPDFREWGPAYWFLNTRAMYWPMLTSGDFDLMGPYFNLYMNALPMAKERNRIYFGHGGAHFPEQLYFWGGFPTDHYGWDRRFQMTE
ncbi:DUF5703 domain-containing protein, partial [Planctomycetota bacterium]